MKIHKKLIFYNFVSIVSIVFLFLVVFELILRNTNWLDQRDNPRPAYFTSEMKLLDQLKELDGDIDSLGFRSKDGHNKLQKLVSSHQNICNIVVIGDSFVWGDGLKVSERGVDKLADLTKCEIHSFGKSGWSSIQEFEFYNYRLKNLKFDHLIIGFVFNDPYLGNILDNKTLNLSNNEVSIFKSFNNQILIKNPNNIMNQLLVSINKLNIKSIDYLFQMLLNFINPFLPNFLELDGTGRDKKKNVIILKNSGIIDYIYSKENLKYWEEALILFKKNLKHKVSFVVTATHKSKHLPKLVPIFEKHSLNLVDCSIDYPDGRPRSYWANIGDNHPGEKENEYFAQCMFSNVVKRVEESY